MGHVYIKGVGMTRLGKRVTTTLKELVAEAVDIALDDAGVSREKIEAAWFCNTRQGIFEGQHGIRGQVALRPLGFKRIPIFNTDNACASSSAGLAQARAFIISGECDIALVVGAEKMNYPAARELMFSAFKGSMDVINGESQLRNLIEIADPMTALPTDFGSERSIFMDFYAAQAKLHMAQYGTTIDQLAEVASKNHRNSEHNPFAQYRDPMTVEQILADKPIVYPFTRSMCAPMSDGAAALVLCSERALRCLGRDRAARVDACEIITGMSHDPRDSSSHIGKLAADRAYETSGIGPGDVSIAEVHDATAFAEIKQIENLGFCEAGTGGPFTAAGHTTINGKIPVNTSGGLLSKGHPIGATGAIQIHELVTQLRGEAGLRQVRNARVAVAENGGGFYDGEEAVTAVTILTQ